MVYSTSLFNITLHQARTTNCNCNENIDVQYNYATLPTVIKLPVFGQEVRADGFVSTISLTVNTNDDFGVYVIGVGNTVGRTTKDFKIVPKGDYNFVKSLCLIVQRVY